MSAEAGGDPIRRALVEQVAAAATPIAIVDLEMRYISASAAWCREYGLEAHALVGKCHYEVFPDIPKRWRELHRRSLAGETLSSELDLFVRARGAVQWLRWSTCPWRDAGGAIGGIVMVVDSRSELHRVQIAADDARAEFEVLFENRALGIVMADWSGRILRANQAFGTLVGRRAAELAGDELAGFFRKGREEAHGEARTEAPDGEFLALFRRLIEGTSPSVSARLALARAGDGPIWVHCTATRTEGSNGSSPRVVYFMHDERERIEFERRMRAADRLASLGMLGAGLGHDLQNVLLPIQAHLNALAALGSERAADAAAEREHVKTGRRRENAGRNRETAERRRENAERQREHVDAMRSCVAYLRQLADGMHFLSRDSTASAVPNATEPVVTVPATWFSTVAPLLVAALPREVRFKEALDPRCPDARIDPSVLTQIVLNLVVNARDAVVQRHRANGRGGEIQIELGPARIERRRAVRIAIVDNGIGMSDAVRAQACEVFFTTKPSGRGTGLGLAMVSRAVEEAGGRLSITSAPGMGTTVEIVLPAAPTPRTPRARA